MMSRRLLMTLPSILEEGGDLVGLGRIARGAVPVSFCPQRGHDVHYQDYLDHEGLPGFETHKGCSSDCVYCIEAGTALRTIQVLLGHRSMSATARYTHVAVQGVQRTASPFDALPEV